jgi:hypothetical protein
VTQQSVTLQWKRREGGNKSNHNNENINEERNIGDKMLILLH